MVVTKHGKPAFRIVAVEHRSPRPIGGNLLGISHLMENFDAPDEEIERLFGARSS